MLSLGCVTETPGILQATTIYMNARWHAQQRQQMKNKIKFQDGGDTEKRRRWLRLSFPRLLKRGTASFDNDRPLKDRVREKPSWEEAGKFIHYIRM